MTNDRNQYNIDETTSRTSTSTTSSRSSSSTSSSTSTSSTASSIYTHPGVYISLTGEQWEELAEYYEKCVGSPMTFPMLEELKDYVAYGMEYGLIRLAMRETALARRPSWHYLNAILEGCMADLALTEADFRSRKRHFQYKKSHPWDDSPWEPHQ